MSLYKMASRVRGLFAGSYAENREDEQCHVNMHGTTLLAQCLPELAEITRQGDSWQVITSAAIASLTTTPTTTAALSLWNGEPATGKCYAIDSIAALEIVVDATQADCTALFAMMNPTPVSPITDAGLVIRSTMGKTYGGRARTTVNTGSQTNSGWFIHGTSAPLPPAAAGTGWKVTDVPLRGLYLVPPGGQFHLHSAKVAGAASQMHYCIRWHEVQLIFKS